MNFGRLWVTSATHLWEVEEKGYELQLRPRIHVNVSSEAL